MQAEIEKHPSEKSPPTEEKSPSRAVRLMRNPLALIALILVGYAGMALWYVRADREASDLQFRADTSRAALRRPSPDVTPLALALEEAESDLASLTASRVTSIPEEDLVRQTLQAAAEAGVVVTSAGTRADTFVQKGGEKVRATPFFVRATGTLDQIEAFLAAMELGRVETLELQSALVTEEKGARALTLAAVIYSHLPLDESGASSQGKATPTPTTAPAKKG